MIYGERVRLRAIERVDLPRFVAWLNNPEVIRTLDQRLPLSSVDEENWFESTLSADPAERPLAIDAQLAEHWTHIGGCGLDKIDPHSRNAELGLFIGDPDHWNQGLGTDVVRTLLRHGFDTLNLHRIYLRVFEFNERGVSVYRKLGFTEEGRLREDLYHEGRYWDTLIMGILQSEWDGMKEGEG